MALNTMDIQPATQEHEAQDVETPSNIQVPQASKEMGREDIGKEEQDTGLSHEDTPNESDNEAEKAAQFSGWDSVDDPANPQNWGFGKKVFHTAIPALYGFVM